MASDDDWFAPKMFGIGAGLPIAWQGWALLGGYLALVASLSALLAERHPAIFAVSVAILTIGLVAIAAQHTRGGWRWRWGGE